MILSATITNILSPPLSPLVVFLLIYYSGVYLTCYNYNYLQLQLLAITIMCSVLPSDRPFVFVVVVPPAVRHLTTSCIPAV